LGVKSDGRLPCGEAFEALGNIGGGWPKAGVLLDH
jgi:hypothetical protein